MKLILVPIDFSECSDNALRFAIGLAQKTAAKLFLLHAFRIPVTNGEFGGSLIVNDLSFEIEKDLAKDFESLEARIPELATIEHEFKIEHGYVHDGILKQANKLNPDLIVMGTKGASGIEAALIGSNTYTIIRDSHCPILAIPKDASLNNFKSIALATDYQSVESKELGMLEQLITMFNSALHIVHIGPEPRLDDNKMNQAQAFGRRFKHFDHHYHFVINENIEDGIIEYIEKNKINLLVLVPRKHTFIDKLFKPSWTRKLAFHTKIPLLTLKT